MAFKATVNLSTKTIPEIVAPPLVSGVGNYIVFFYISAGIIPYTLVYKKVDISNTCISFVSLGETKEKTKGIYIYIYISEMSTFL